MPLSDIVLASCVVGLLGVIGGGIWSGASGRGFWDCSGDCEGVAGLVSDGAGIGGRVVWEVLGTGVISSGEFNLLEARDAAHILHLAI